MTVTETARVRGVRRVTATPLPTELEHLAPSAVVEASRHLAAAQTRAAEANAAHRASREAVVGAHAADEAAALDAAAAGKPVPRPTAPKAQATADEAARVKIAQAEVAQRAAANYVAAVRDAAPAIRDAAEAELSTVADGAVVHFNAIEAALAQAREVKMLLRALDADALVGREPSFVPVRQNKRARNPLSADAVRHLDGLRETLRN